MKREHPLTPDVRIKRKKIQLHVRQMEADDSSCVSQQHYHHSNRSSRSRRTYTTVWPAQQCRLSVTSGSRTACRTKCLMCLSSIDWVGSRAKYCIYHNTEVNHLNASEETNRLKPWPRVEHLVHLDCLRGGVLKRNAEQNSGSTHENVKRANMLRC